MEAQRPFRPDLKLIFMTLDAALLGLSFLVATPAEIVFYGQTGLDVPGWGTRLFYGLLTLFVFYQAGFYSRKLLSSPLRNLVYIPLGMVFAACLHLGLRELVWRSDKPFPTEWVSIQLAAGAVFVVVGRISLWQGMRESSVLGATDRVAFLGWTERLDRVIHNLKLNSPQGKAVVGFFHSAEGPVDSIAEEKGYRCLGTMGSLETKLVEEGITVLVVDENVIVLSDLPVLGEVCSRCLVSLKVIPSAFDFWATQLRIELVSGIPLLGIYDMRHEYLRNRILRRAVDIAGALVGLALAAPAMLVCSWLIMLESPGPVIYRQRRVGLHGKTFEILKLRSMKLNAEAATGVGWTVENDPRRLKIGEFLRKWNLDELPQFWNVLKGDMSLVGPRPERPEFVEGFSTTIRHYNMRLTMKPGLTGWAAIHGLRGNTSILDRLEYDLYYIENWSIWLDFIVMFKTFSANKNAY